MADMKPKPHYGRRAGVNKSYEIRYTESEIRELASRGSVCKKSEAGRVLGMHPDTVQKLALKGEIPSFKRGAQRLYNVRQLAALVGVEV